LPGAGFGHGAPGGRMFTPQRTQVRFTQPIGMKVTWLTQGADGKPTYVNPPPIDAPGRYNFLQGAIYRLKLSNLESRPGVELHPTLEVVPSTMKTDDFLAHSAVPVEFTPEDFKQIADGNYVIKVIYLPDPQFQELTGTGTDQIVSTRLEPGINPITEAMRRGSILLVIRMGNVWQETPNTPPLDAGGKGPPAGMVPHGMMPPGMPPGGPMMPFGMRPPTGLPGGPVMISPPP